MRARDGRRVLAWSLAAAAAAGATGCDWRDFDNLEKTTPVQAIKAPSNYPAGDDFGPIILPLAPPADHSSAGRFIATATNRPSVGVMSFDAAGNASGAGVTNDALTMLGSGPASAIAAIPGGTQVLLGSPFGSSGAVLVMNVNPPYQTMTFMNIYEALYGVGVGAGNIGGAAAPEFVVVSATTLHVYTDGIPTAEHNYPSLGATDPCPIAFSTNTIQRDLVNRPILVAQLMATGTQIAVGTPTTGGAGHVSIFDFDATTGAVTCAAALSQNDVRFGRSMTLVHLLTTDGTPDYLLVGAPPTHAYLYKLPLTSGQAPAATAADAMGGGDFGAAVAAFDIDGKPGDEMFVGDPDATVNGATTAGRVTIFTGPTMTMLAATATLPNPLAMHEPKAGNGYGSGIASVPFCPGAVGSSGADGGGGLDAGVGAAACVGLPLIGSLSRVYAYFTLKPPDPRVK